MSSSSSLGHNGGPPLDPAPPPDPPPDPDAGWRLYCWRKAHKRAWKTPPREIALRRLALAKAAGMTYHEFTLELMERGRYPTARR